MPAPPSLTFKGKDIDYFDKLIKAVHIYYPELTLCFDGYTETIEEYKHFNQSDTEMAWKLAKELNAWSEYFSDLANLVQQLYLDAETDKLCKQSTQSINYSEKNVSAGDRSANIQPDVVEARKKRNALKSFYDELLAKVKFLERCYYHCKTTYEWGHRLKELHLESM